MFGIGGPNFFGDIYMYTYACICQFFYVRIANRNS